MEEVEGGGGGEMERCRAVGRGLDFFLKKVTGGGSMVEEAEGSDMVKDVERGKEGSRGSWREGRGRAKPNPLGLFQADKTISFYLSTTFPSKTFHRADSSLSLLDSHPLHIYSSREEQGWIYLLQQEC